MRYDVDTFENNPEKSHLLEGMSSYRFQRVIEAVKLFLSYTQSLIIIFRKP